MPPPSRGVRNARPTPRPRLTHFLALTSSALTPTHTISPTKPLSNPMAATYNRFRTIATSPPHNIPPQAIRPLGTMHLTLGVMSLKDEGEVERAKRALGEAVERYKLEREKERKKERVGEEEGGGAGTGVGGVRVKLVGLRTFDPQGHGPRRKRRKDKRGKAFGSISGNSSNSTNMTGVSTEEAEEIEDAEEEGEGGGEVEGEGDDRPAWEQLNKDIPESIPSNPKPDYSNCRVLWVEPLDFDTPTSTTTTSNSQTPSLHSLSLFLRDFFLSQNLLSIPPQEKNQPLTLHLTMLNASHAKKALQSSHGGGGRGRGGGGGGKGDHHKEGYDVRELVKEFENVVWADNVLFDRVEVMRMGEVKGEIGSEREGESWYVSVESAEL